jgi:hypothetical protein
MIEAEYPKNRHALSRLLAAGPIGNVLSENIHD